MLFSHYHVFSLLEHNITVSSFQRKRVNWSCFWHYQVTNYQPPGAIRVLQRLNCHNSYYLIMRTETNITKSECDHQPWALKSECGHQAWALKSECGHQAWALKSECGHQAWVRPSILNAAIKPECGHESWMQLSNQSAVIKSECTRQAWVRPSSLSAAVKPECSHQAWVHQSTAWAQS